MESGYCSDSNGKYIVFGLTVDALCVSKGGLIHEVVFWHECSEYDLKIDPVVRARMRIERHKPVVDYDDSVDVYYLPTLKPRNLDTGQSQNDVCANNLVHIMLARTHRRPIDCFSLSERNGSCPTERPMCVGRSSIDSSLSGESSYRVTYATLLGTAGSTASTVRMLSLC